MFFHTDIPLEYGELIWSVDCLFDATWQISRSLLKSFGLCVSASHLNNLCEENYNPQKISQDACNQSVLYSAAIN